MRRIVGCALLGLALATAFAFAQVITSGGGAPYPTLCNQQPLPGTNTIQAAINALPATGGTVCLGTGTYTQTMTLTLGNGSTSALSTRVGIVLFGAAPPVTAMLQTGYTPSAATIISCGSTSPCVSVQGPLEGWELRNLAIKDTGTDCLLVTSAAYGNSENLYIEGCKNGVHSTTLTSFTPGGNFDSLRNQYRNVHIKMHSAGGGKAWFFDGGNPNANTDFNVVIGGGIAGPGGSDGSTTATCWWFKWSDNNRFYDAHCFITAAGSNSLVLDWTGWGPPINNMFFGVETGTAFMGNNGSPTAQAGRNMIFGFSEANNAQCKPFPGMFIYGCGSITFANLGTPDNGYVVYCSDCRAAKTCASGGTGALAKRINGAWVCN